MAKKTKTNRITSYIAFDFGSVERKSLAWDDLEFCDALKACGFLEQTYRWLLLAARYELRLDKHGNNLGDE